MRVLRIVLCLLILLLLLVIAIVVHHRGAEPIHQRTSHLRENQKPLISPLNVASYNVFLRPAILNIGQHNRERAAAIGAWAQHNNFHLMLLQEAWDMRALEQLVESVPQLKHIVTSRRPSLPKALISSGLMILSAYPIIDTKEMIYHACSGADCLSTKGLLYAAIQPRSGPKLHIITTHLNAGADATAIASRRSQLTQLKAWIAHHIPKDEQLIIAGDFNVDAKSRPEEYAFMVKTLGLSPISYPMNGTVNCHGQTVRCPNSVPEKQLDYIFINQRTQGELELVVEHHPNLIDVNGQKLYASDHRAVSLTRPISVR